MDGFRLCLALGPLAIYLVLLAWINLSRKPFVVSGARDLAALGVAVSGMVLVGPIELLLPEQAIYVYKGYVWLLLGVMYALCVSLAALLARPRLTIYNFTVDQLRPLLAEVIDELDSEARWAGGCLALPKLRVELHLDSSPALNNVSLVATGDDQSFAGWRRLEGALATRLRQAESPANALGVVLAIGSFLLGACVGWQVLVHPQAVTAGFREMLRL
ncbi:MAG TPA: hypothetical protein VG125_21655 [Pirellulales bacterium]|jgi:hypothetical protein|nr:hypothetical protein [Pirellulales bacterium]